MKSIIIGSILNVILISGGLVYAHSLAPSSAVMVFLVYVLVCFLSPVIGFVYNAATQKRFDILLSTIATSAVTSILIILPIEWFKHTDKVGQAKETVMGNTYGSQNSQLTLNIDLSFNVVNHITSGFFLILMASVIGFVFKKIRGKKHTKNQMAAG